MARIAWDVGAELERGENDREDVAGVIDQADRQQLQAPTTQAACPCAGGVYASVSSLLASLADSFNGESRGDAPEVCRVAACRVVATGGGEEGREGECRVENLHGPTLDWSLSVEDLDDFEASTASTSQDLYSPAVNTSNANTSTRSSNSESVCTKATIEDLPDEALLHVFSYVAAGGGGLARIARISTVSRQFARVGRDALLRRSAIWDAHTSVLDHISEGGRLTDSGLRGCLRWLRGEAVEFRFRSYDDYRASAPMTATWRELGFLCPALTTLELYHIRQVDDSVVATIAAHCRQLRTVRLERCAVGDDGVEALALCCPSLTSLHASVHLAHMSLQVQSPPNTSPNTYTNIQFTHPLLQDGRPPLGYSGRALRALACRDSLRVLKLKSSCHEMDDASLKEFVMGCKKLRVLTLFMAVNLTDASLAEVGSGLRELESLSLDCWYSATDEGLVSLRGLSRLHTFKARYGGIGFTGNGLLSVVRNCPAVRKVKANYHVTVGACLALLDQQTQPNTTPTPNTPTQPSIRPDLLPQLWNDVLTAVEKLCGGLDDSHASAHALDVPHDPNPHNSPWSSVDLSHGTIRLITGMVEREGRKGDESQVLRLLLALEMYIYGLSALTPDGPDAEDFLTQEKRVQLDEAIIARTPQVVVSLWHKFSNNNDTSQNTFSGMVPARACAVLGQLQDLAAQLGPARKCEMACALLACGAVKLAAEGLVGLERSEGTGEGEGSGMTLKELNTMRARELGYLLMRSDRSSSLSHSRLAYYYAARAHVTECRFRARGFERMRMRTETLHTLAAALAGLSTLPALTTDQESQLRAALLPSDNILSSSLPNTDLICSLLSIASEVPKLSLCRNECHLGGFTGFDDWPSWLLHQHRLAVANVCDVLGALCLRTCPAHDGVMCRTAHPKPHLPHLRQKLLARVVDEDEAWRQMLQAAHGLICGYDTQQQQHMQMAGRGNNNDLSASRVAALLFQLIIELAELAGDCAIGQTGGHEFVRG
eukprot:jgi/Chlat1/9261/Chrsp99S08527